MSSVFRSDKQNQQIGKYHESIRKDNSKNNLNQLEKYKILKLMSSGDYLCNDQLGNNYLLVCQYHEGGLQEFKSSTINGFHRNNNNRALLTPFQDIVHNGLTFTVYMLPQRSQWIGEIFSSKNKTELYCLSLLYTLINKVLRPLLQIFNTKADKWLHLQNIWIKQSTIFYILNQRNKQNKRQRTSQHKFQSSQSHQLFIKQKYQKRILRKICCILIPYFKIDPELKSFLSIIVDAMLNQQYTIEQVCQFLNNKKKRKEFMEQKKQLINQNNQKQPQQFVAMTNQLWGKKRYYYVDNNRKGLKNQTINIESVQNSLNYNYNRLTKNIGQTIHIPPSFNSKKRSSLSNSRGLFNLRNEPNKKKKSLSSQKSKYRYSQSRTRGFSENIEQNIVKKLKSQLQMSDNSRNYSIHVTVRQRAQQKFREKLQSQNHQEIKTERRSIDQQQKHLRAFLQERSKEKEKRKKFSTIDVSQLGQNVFKMNKYSISQTIEQNTSNSLKKQLFVAQQPVFMRSGYLKYQNQVQKIKNFNQDKSKFETIDLSKNQQKQKERLKHLQIQKQLKRLKQIQREQQRQIQKLRQKQRQRQKSRERQKQRELQAQKQIQKQKQRQLQLLKQKEKQIQRQIQKQRQRQKQKQKELQQQRNRQRKKQKQEQQKYKQGRQIEAQNKLIQQKIKKQGQLKKNESAKAMNTIYTKKSQQFNLDQIQIVQPRLKADLQAKKRQQQKKQKQKLQKEKNMKQPPLPNQAKQSNSQKKASINDQQLQQIDLTKKAGVQQSQQNKKTPRIEPPKEPPKEQVKQETKRESLKKQKINQESGSRTKTVTSQIASSCGPKKPVSKQVAEYMHMINKMGQSVAKSSKISAKLEGVQWFTGIYFVYKRFLFQRKKIQKWLQKNEPNLTRYNEKNKGQWQQWFKTQQKKSLFQKVKIQNQNIVSSIIKMNKKIMKKSLPGNFLFHAALSKHSEQQSKIAVSEVVKEYDDLDQMQKLKDEEILTHVNQLLNSIYIMAQLDGKINQKKPLIQILKKKNQEQLSEFSDYLYNLYIKE